MTLNTTQFFIACMLVLILSVTNSQATLGIGAERSASFKKQGLIAIPGLGRSDRLNIVIHNLKLLSKYISGINANWDCIVYVYTPRNDTEFWGSIKQLNSIISMCDIVDNPHKRIVEHLHMIHPTFLERGYENLFILLDDCKLISETATKDFPLDDMLNIMKFNNLTLASPRVR